MSDASPSRAGRQDLQLLPGLSSDEYESLKADLAGNGQREPIYTWGDGGPVVDGHHRERACAELGLTPHYEALDFEDETAAKAFALRVNLSRRQLSQGQWREARKRQRALYGEYRERGFTQQQAASAVGVPDGTAAWWDSEDREPEEQSEGEPDSESEGGSDIPILGAKNGNKDGSTDTKRRPDLREAIPKDEHPRILSLVDEHGWTQEAVADEYKATQPTIAKIVKKQRQKAEEARREQERQRELAERAAQTAERIDIRHGDFRESLADLDGRVDAIITDPPYPRDYLPLLSDLSEHAARLLRPGGICAVMMGQSYLPEVYQRLTEHLTYRWTMAYLTPGGQSAQLWDRKVNTFWKPVILFTNGDADSGDWIGDVAKSDTNDNDKRRHHWGQSESGTAKLVDTLTDEDELVCDPFLGGGTTAAIALDLGRLFVGCDIDLQAVVTARQRLGLGDAA